MDKPIKDFDSLMARFRAMSRMKCVAVVCPDDEPSIEMLEECLSQNLAKFFLVSTNDRCAAAERLAARYPSTAYVYKAADMDEAAAKGVEMIRTGEADVLMKGNINTDNLLRAVLNRETGLLPNGNVMSHVTVSEIPGYDRLVIFSDAAVIPAPTLEQFCSMVRCDVDVARTLGIPSPKVALIHFSEKVNQKFPHTIDYVQLKEMCAHGQFGDAVVDGPMDVKTACDSHSGAIKGIESPVAGCADVVIFPNLVAANTFYKTISCFCKAGMAGMLTGTSAPVVIPSRADAPESKMYSLALACVMADNNSL